MFFRRNSAAFVFHSIRKGTIKKKCRVSHCWCQEEKHKASCDSKAKTNPCRKVTASELLSTTPYIWLLTLHELKECRYTLKVETNQGLDNYSHIHLKSIEIWAIFRLIRIKLQLSWSHLADCCIFPCRRTPVMSDSMIGWQQCYAVGAVYFRCVASGAHLNYTISFERNLPDPPIQTVAQPHTHEWTYISVLRAFVFSAKGRRDTSNTGQSSPIIAHFLCLTVWHMRKFLYRSYPRCHPIEQLNCKQLQSLTSKAGLSFNLHNTIWKKDWNARAKRKWVTKLFTEIQAGGWYFLPL